MKKLNKRWAMTSAVSGLVALLFIGFTNAMPARLAPLVKPVLLPSVSNKQKTQSIAKEMVSLAKTALWHLDQARLTNVPAEQQEHFKAASDINDKIQAYNNSLNKSGALLNPGSSKVTTCQVVNEPCTKRNLSQVQELKLIDTTSESTCLNYATSEQKNCKSMSVATFYENGGVKNRKVVGNTCMLYVSQCSKHPDWVGTFRSFDTAANDSRSTCMAEAKGYLKDCKESVATTVFASYYENGILRETKDGSGKKY